MIQRGSSIAKWNRYRFWLPANHFHASSVFRIPLPFTDATYDKSFFCSRLQMDSTPIGGKLRRESAGVSHEWGRLKRRLPLETSQKLTSADWMISIWIADERTVSSILLLLLLLLLLRAMAQLLQTYVLCTRNLDCVERTNKKTETSQIQWTGHFLGRQHVRHFKMEGLGQLMQWNKDCCCGFRRLGNPASKKIDRKPFFLSVANDA